MRADGECMVIWISLPNLGGTAKFGWSPDHDGPRHDGTAKG